MGRKDSILSGSDQVNWLAFPGGFHRLTLAKLRRAKKGAKDPKAYANFFGRYAGFYLRHCCKRLQLFGNVFNLAYF
jgi:hypothetical protein